MTIENRDRIIIVAEENNKIIGYFKGGIENAPNYITPKKIGVIDDAFIKKEHRNKGIGDKLLNQMIKYFRIKKIKYIGLSVDARNTIGVNFWKENDFFEHRIEMRKIL